MRRTISIGLDDFEIQTRPLAQRYLDALLAPHSKISESDKTHDFKEVYWEGNYIENLKNAAEWAISIISETELDIKTENSDIGISYDLLKEVPNIFKNPNKSEINSALLFLERRFSGTIFEICNDGTPNDVLWYACNIYSYYSTITCVISEIKSCEDPENPEKETHPELHALNLSGICPFDFIGSCASKAGFIYRDAWWKFNHEQAAMNYYEQDKRLKEQSSKGADSTAKRYADLRQSCLDYFPQAYAEKGIIFIGAPMRVVAETIREIALRERPADFVSPQGDALKLRWFIETLEKFQAEGAFGEAIEDAIRGPKAL